MKTLPVLSLNSMKCWYLLQNKNPIRRFIRYPSDVPIQVTLDWVDDADDGSSDDTLTNISHGGLSFKSNQALVIGQKISVSIPVLGSEASLIGKVVWCAKAVQGFDIGLELENSREIFRLRMIEQVCHIEHYRSEIKRKEGRELSAEDAAREWISRYAGDFPAL